MIFNIRKITLNQMKKHTVKYFVTRIINFLSQVRKDLSGKPLRDAPEEKALAVCWKTAKPIKSILDIKSFFKPLTINFIKAKNVQLQLAPEDYLIITVSTSKNLSQVPCTAALGNHTFRHQQAY